MYKIDSYGTFKKTLPKYKQKQIMTILLLESQQNGADVD